MPKYLISVSYTTDGAKGLRKDGGTKRRHVIGKAIESLGGKLEAFYYCLGDRDAIVIAEAPDNIAVAGLTLAVAASGTARVATTPLLTPEDIDHASEKKTAYRPAGK